MTSPQDGDDSFSEKSSHKIFGFLGEQEKKDVMQGDLSGEHSLKSKVIRIFVCSTFTDTQVERNVLLQDLYPQLKKHCHSYGMDFQIVDMRWGVQDEAVDEHLVSELCLQEIKLCQEMSIGPQFVTFLGQKYGFRPLLAAIPQQDFESIMTCIEEPTVKATLLQWYKKDTNAVPAVYVLQPVSTYLPYCNSEKADAREQDRQRWNELHRLMTNALRRAARSAIKDRQRIRAFLSSVTEQEIIQGIFNCPGNPNEHCWWFKREIQNLRKCVHQDPTTYVYIDVIPGTKEADAEALSLLARLKEDKIPAKYVGLNNSNIIPYTIKWQKGGIDPDAHEEHKQYVQKFRNDFYITMKAAIDCAYQAYKLQSGDNLYQEVLQHIKFAKGRQKLFQGRDCTLSVISTYLKSNDQVPLVVHGESGCGKTSVMAVAAAKLHTVNPRCVIILRFLGTTVDSSSARLMLSSICRQINEAYNVFSSIPENYKDLVTCFIEKMHLATEELPLFIFLDSLDQLSEENDGRQLSWLPIKLPHHVHIIVSTLPDRKYKCFPALQMMISNPEQFVEVPRLSSSECEQIFYHWLQQSNRTLTDTQKGLVLNAFKHCSLALFLRLAFNEAIQWKSYARVTELSLPTNVKSMINMLFDHLEIRHGYKLVKHALGYITAANMGISEAELEDMLSCDDEVLAEVYKYWTPQTHRLPPLIFSRIRYDLGEFIVERAVGSGTQALCWYHRQFHEVATERYLVDVQFRCHLHSAAADCYLGKWAGVKKQWLDTDKAYDRMVGHQPLVFGDGVNTHYNYRKMSELPWHLVHAKRFDELHTLILTNLAWLQTKLCAMSLPAVIADFSYVVPTVSTTRPDSQGLSELSLILECLQLSANAIGLNSDHLTSQLVGRLMLLSVDQDNSSFLQKLFDQAVRLDGPIILPILPCFPAPGGPLKASLEGHTNFVSCLAIAKRPRQSGNGDELVVMSGSWDQTVRVWNVDKGSTTELLTGHTDWVTDVAVHKNGLFGVSSSADGTVRHWNLLTADCLGVLRANAGAVNAVVMTSDGFKAISAGKDKQLKVWHVDPQSRTYGEMIFSLSGHQHHVTCLALSSDDNTIISGSKDKSVRVWNLKLGNLVKTLEGHTATVTCVAIQDNIECCRVVSCSDDRMIRVWDITTGSVLHTLKDHQDRVQAVAISVSGLIVSGAVDKTVRVWLPDSDRCVRVFEGHRGAICGIAITNDSQLAISASADDTLRVWDVQAESPLYKLPSHTNTVTDIKTDPLDKFVFSSSLDGTIQIYSFADHFQSVEILGNHGRSVECVALSHDGHLLLSASSDHNLKLWDVKKHTELRTYCKHADWVNAIVFTDDDHHCVSGSDDKTVVVWEVATGRAIRSLSGHKAAVKSVSYLQTETHHLIVSGSCDRTVRVWNLLNGSQLHILSGHGNDVRFVATALAGVYGPVVVSTSRDKTAKLWSLETAVCIRTFYGHQLPVNSGLLLKDGLHLLTASSDKTIRLWSIESGASLASFYAESGVTCLALAADEHTVIFGTNNGWISNAWLRLAGCNNPLPIPNLEKYIKAAAHKHQVFGVSASDKSEGQRFALSTSDEVTSPLTIKSELAKREETTLGHSQEEDVVSFPTSRAQRAEELELAKTRMKIPSDTEVHSREVSQVSPRVVSQQPQTSFSCALL